MTPRDIAALDPVTLKTCAPGENIDNDSFLHEALLEMSGGVERTLVGLAGDGAILFLSVVKESSDAFPPLKTVAAGILVLVDVVKVFHIYLSRKVC